LAGIKGVGMMEENVIEYKEELRMCISNMSSFQMMTIAQEIIECKGTVYILGNGGSLATAQHLACDLSKNTGKSIRTDTLTELPKVTAYANDNGFEYIYQMQLFSKLKPGDIIFNISTSGNSKNLVQATAFAKDQGNMIISLLGYGGGVLKDYSDLYMIVPSRDVRVVEDAHSIICHMLTTLVQEGKKND
jgi:D-sedoheptulose 7-phosphate isomerase